MKSVQEKNEGKQNKEIMCTNPPYHKNYLHIRNMDSEGTGFCDMTSCRPVASYQPVEGN